MLELRVSNLEGERNSAENGSFWRDMAAMLAGSERIFARATLQELANRLTPFSEGVLDFFESIRIMYGALWQIRRLSITPRRDQ